MVGRSEFRTSQGVVPFGVGAITDFPDESLMMAGLDVWPHMISTGEIHTRILESTRVIDGRLAGRLSTNLERPIDSFRTPTIAPEIGSFASAAARLQGKAPMPFVRFPNWHFCPYCRKLTEIPWNTQKRDDQLRCSNKGRRVRGVAQPCGDLPKYRRPHLVPVRFVAACEGGHIFDFPWSMWAHSRSTNECESGDGDLYLCSTTAAGLAGVIVVCNGCGGKRTMAGSFQRDSLNAIFNSGCPGHRPWLGPDAIEKNCSAIPQTIQRGASNAYFANVVSSILIPPYSAELRQTIDQPDLWKDIINLPKQDGGLATEWIRKKGKNLGFDPDVFLSAVEQKLQREESDDDGVSQEVTEEEYRLAEYKAFNGKRPPAKERRDFDIQDVSIGQYDQLFGEFFEKVVLVKKLRETRVLTGFSRIVPPEALDRAPAQLSLNPLNWLPGFSVRGEGIFIVLRGSKLTTWNNTEGQVATRTATVRDRLTKLYLSRGQEIPNLHPEEVLIHTLAHLIIRQMAFECGYDSSSLRERLYTSQDKENPMRGILIYTASGDSEGTLGGLVRQGKPGRLDKTILSAIRNAEICSSDPLCIEATGQGTNGLNMAACHACCLLPETSCEKGNLILDRAMIVGNSEYPKVGYFRGCLSIK